MQNPARTRHSRRAERCVGKDRSELRLVQLAMEICGADSAGISVLEGEIFRWFNLKGKLSVFEGATTPRNFSPCGVCLDRNAVVLMERPERVYTWISDAKITVPEVLRGYMGGKTTIQPAD